MGSGASLPGAPTRLSRPRAATPTHPSGGSSTREGPWAQTRLCGRWSCGRRPAGPAQHPASGHLLHPPRRLIPGGRHLRGVHAASAAALSAFQSIAPTALQSASVSLQETSGEKSLTLPPGQGGAGAGDRRGPTRGFQAPVTKMPYSWPFATPGLDLSCPFSMSLPLRGRLFSAQATLSPRLGTPSRKHEAKRL